ncbi:MAG: TonB-dependent receptor [Pseudomonadota bacterium]
MTALPSKNGSLSLQSLIARSVFCASISILGASALAQNSVSDKQAVIEEVVVTALRRGEETGLMDTPLAVSALTGDLLEARGTSSVMGALTSVPGVSVVRNTNVGDSVMIRGISAVVGDSPVGYYLDDLPYTRISANILPDTNPYDLKRIEVLRGPQGTLFGAGSAGGTVRILTNDPVLDEFSGKITGGASATDGGGDNWKVQGALNVPLIEDTLALRIVGAQIDNGGFIDLPLAGEDDFNTLDDTSYRVKLLWQATDQLSIMGSYWHSERETFQDWGDDNYEQNLLFVATDILTGGPGTVVGPVTSDSLYANTENDLYGLTVKYRTDSLEFTSTTSKLEGSYENALAVLGLFQEQAFPVLDTFAQELRIASVGSSRVNWNAGVMYLDMENESQNSVLLYLDVPGIGVIPNESVINSAVETSESWAVYGEIAYQLNDVWEITLGLRYFEDERTLEDKLPAIVDTLAALGIDNPRSGEFDQVTGRFNLAWTPNDNSLYYANIAQGFRSGGNNPGDALIQATLSGIDVPSTIDPDEVISYELGAKWTLLDNALNLEAALYYLDWDDIQALLLGAGQDGVFGYALNTEGAEGLGFEFGINYQVGQLSLAATGNFNQTEYTGSTPAAGIVDGSDMRLSPDTTLSASATYGWRIGSLGGIAYLGATYFSDRTDYAAPQFTYTSDDITLVNARIGIEGDTWSAYLTGENLTDEDGEFSQIASLAQLGVDANRVRPLTVGVELNYNF